MATQIQNKSKKELMPGVTSASYFDTQKSKDLIMQMVEEHDNNPNSILKEVWYCNKLYCNYVWLLFLLLTGSNITRYIVVLSGYYYCDMYNLWQTGYIPWTDNQL